VQTQPTAYSSRFLEAPRKDHPPLPLQQSPLSCEAYPQHVAGFTNAQINNGPLPGIPPPTPRPHLSRSDQPPRSSDRHSDAPVGLVDNTPPPSAGYSTSYQSQSPWLAQPAFESDPAAQASAAASTEATACTEAAFPEAAASLAAAENGQQEPFGHPAYPPQPPSSGDDTSGSEINHNKQVGSLFFSGLFLWYDCCYGCNYYFRF